MDLESSLPIYKVTDSFRPYETSYSKPLRYCVLPAAVTARLNAELQKILGDADTQARFAANGMEPAPGTAAAFDARLHDEVGKWAKVVRAAGIKPE